MAKGPDPNRWTKTEPEAAEDDGLGVRERPSSHGLRWLILGGVVLLVVLFLALTA
jgi:hypothetical protein